MSKVAATVNEELKPVNDDILALSKKIVASVKGQEGGIKDNHAEIDNAIFVENLPEGLDEKQAKAFINYVTTARNGVLHATQELGISHLKKNKDADSFSLKAKMFGRDHVTAKIIRGTSTEDAGNMTVDTQYYDVGRNMGQHNLIVKHANAAAREALKFD